MEILIGLLSIGIGIFLGLFFGLKPISETLSEIKKNTEDVDDIHEIAIKLEDRTRNIGGSVERHLEDLDVDVNIRGKDKSDNWTEFSLNFSEKLLDSSLVERGFRMFRDEEGDELAREGYEIGDTPPEIRVTTPRRALLKIYSTDLDLCADFVDDFLDWFDEWYYRESQWKDEFEERFSRRR